MNEKLLEYHNFLNSIYINAENLLYELLKKSYKAKLNSYNNHYINIYEFNDCTIDIYIKEESVDKLLKKIKNSKDTKFGISINCSSFSNKDIIIHFDNVCNLLNFN